MRILCIGDQHFAETNPVETDLIIDRCAKVASQTQPDLIVCLGDMLHTHEKLHTLPLNKATEFVDTLSKISKVMVLVGNHDMIKNTEFLTTNHWLNSMKKWNNVTVVDQGLYDHENDLLFVPYVHNGLFYDAIYDITENTTEDTTEKSKKDILLEKEDPLYRRAKIIFAHQEFKGALMGAFPSVEGDEWSSEEPFVVSGHIHLRHMPQTNIYYSGSVMEHTHGEEGFDSTVSIIELPRESKEGHDDAFESLSKLLTFPVRKAQWDTPLKIFEVNLQLPRKKTVVVKEASIKSLIETIEKTLNKEAEKEGDTGEDASSKTRHTRFVINGTEEEFRTLKKNKKYQELCSSYKIDTKPSRKQVLRRKEKIKKRLGIKEKESNGNEEKSEAVLKTEKLIFEDSEIRDFPSILKRLTIEEGDRVLKIHESVSRRHGL